MKQKKDQIMDELSTLEHTLGKYNSTVVEMISSEFSKQVPYHENEENSEFLNLSKGVNANVVAMEKASVYSPNNYHDSLAEGSEMMGSLLAEMYKVTKNKEFKGMSKDYTKAGLDLKAFSRVYLSMDDY